MAQVDVGEEKACYGCSRTFASGRDYIDPTNRVVWVSSGRGHWCKDCWTAWRTCYSCDHSLPLFQRWLREEQNKREWRARALQNVEAIIEAGAVDDEEVVVRDTIANLMHWCAERNIDFQYEYEVGQRNFQAEIEGTP